MHADILRVTRAIEERSKDLRDDYLSDVDAMRRLSVGKKEKRLLRQRAGLQLQGPMDSVFSSKVDGAVRNPLLRPPPQ